MVPRSDLDPRLGTGPRAFRALLLAAVLIAAFGVLAATALSRRDAPARRVTVHVGTDARSMIFDRPELTVPAGSTVTVVFRNNLRTATMSHNWVLVERGTERAVAEAGRRAGAGSHFVAARDSHVIAAIPLTPPGQERSVTFASPPPGSYPYVCTFPGHYLVMRGTLRVIPASSLRASQHDTRIRS